MHRNTRPFDDRVAAANAGDADDVAIALRDGTHIRMVRAADGSVNQRRWAGGGGVVKRTSGRQPPRVSSATRTKPISGSVRNEAPASLIGRSTPESPPIVPLELPTRLRRKSSKSRPAAP